MHPWGKSLVFCLFDFLVWFTTGSGEDHGQYQGKISTKWKGKSVANCTEFKKCHGGFQHSMGKCHEQSETALLGARGRTGWLSKVLSKLNSSMTLKRKNKPTKPPKPLRMLFHDPFASQSWQHQISYLSKNQFKNGAHIAITGIFSRTARRLRTGELLFQNS